jgi:hypothetical protein
MIRSTRSCGQGARLLRAALFALLVVLPAGAAGGQGADLFQPGPESDGEREMETLTAAYPSRISVCAFLDGDWAVCVEGEWFSWAHGRILPEARRGEWEGFAPFRLYHYAPGPLPPLPELDAQAAARLKETLEASRRHPPERSEAFLGRLFSASTEAETGRRIVSVSFLGLRVRVHEAAAPALREVAAECAQARAADPGVAAFFAGIDKLDGFNWRDVAGTLSRSYHSYGLAVDFIPRSYGRKATYWRWVMGNTEQWWAIPYEKRWSVPQPVVDAFERHGFVWGGKWLFYDTMHFEYRPEILLLAAEPEPAAAP